MLKRRPNYVAAAFLCSCEGIIPGKIAWVARGGARSVEGGLHERFARARDRLYAHLADGQMQLPLHLLHAG